MNELAALEAILFVTEEPAPEAELAEVLELPVPRVRQLLDELGRGLEERGSGLVLRQTGGGWRLYSHPDAYPYLERFSGSATARRMSAAALAESFGSGWAFRGFFLRSGRKGSLTVDR